MVVSGLFPVVNRIVWLAVAGSSVFSHMAFNVRSRVTGVPKS